MEIYKEIQGFKSIYTISNKGNVKNIKTNKILKPGRHTQGYMQIVLSINNKQKTFKIHRLIAQTFLEHKIKGKPFDVKFIDGNYRNLKLSNLSINFRKVIKL